MTIKQRLAHIEQALAAADVDAVRGWLQTLDPRQLSALREALELATPTHVTGLENLSDQELDRLIADGEE
jgi:hypothetical protein